MNEFLTLLNASGLSKGKAAEVLKVQYDSVKAWCTGQKNFPDGVLVDLLPHAQKNLEESTQKVEQIAQRLSNINSDDGQNKPN